MSNTQAQNVIWPLFFTHFLVPEPEGPEKNSTEKKNVLLKFFSFLLLPSCSCSSFLGPFKLQDFPVFGKPVFFYNSVYFVNVPPDAHDAVERPPSFSLAIFFL